MSDDYRDMLPALYSSQVWRKMLEANLERVKIVIVVQKCDGGFLAYPEGKPPDEAEFGKTREDAINELRRVYYKRPPIQLNPKMAEDSWYKVSNEF
ncbi:MAG: hypothetical protein GY774_40020 [Planctomycetes bacterium]|nr:hypothetical protein [Planctomycetota bacterium]